MKRLLTFIAMIVLTYACHGQALDLGDGDDQRDGSKASTSCACLGEEHSPFMDEAPMLVEPGVSRPSAVPCIALPYHGVQHVPAIFRPPIA